MVGCDNGIESGLKLDRCGFCGGDSSKCKFVEKFWNDRCPGFGKLAYFFVRTQNDQSKVFLN